jgi:hypothetical protein
LRQALRHAHDGYEHAHHEHLGADHVHLEEVGGGDAGPAEPPATSR